MNFNLRQNGSWIQRTPYKRENGSWVSLGGGGTEIPDDATMVSQDGGTIIGETSNGTQYTGSSLHTVVEDISNDVDGAIGIESGTYDWTGMATLSNNTDIIGDGEVILDIHSRADDDQAIDLYDVTDNVTIENLIFQCNDETGYGAVSRREGSTSNKTNISVRNCEFHDFVNETHVVNADNWEDSLIENNLFTGVGYSAIRLHVATGTVRGNTIHLPPNAQQGIMSDQRSTLIEDNTIYLGDASGDPSHAIHLRDLWAEWEKDITLRNNTVEADASSTDSNGVRVETNLVTSLDIEGNTFHNTDRGVTGLLQSGTTITSNEFNSCRIGVESTDSSDIDLSDNEFINCTVDIDL